LARASYIQHRTERQLPKGEVRMTQLNSDTAPKSGSGTDSDRLSMSPQSIRRGGADYTDIGPGPVQSNVGTVSPDTNDVPMGVEPPPFAASK
jgi:hypothetical protein